MTQVYCTLKLREEAILDGMKWEKLENGWYLSPELTTEQANRYLTLDWIRPVVVPAAPAAPAAPKKPAAKKTTAKTKGGA